MLYLTLFLFAPAVILCGVVSFVAVLKFIRQLHADAAAPDNAGAPVATRP